MRYEVHEFAGAPGHNNESRAEIHIIETDDIMAYAKAEHPEAVEVFEDEGGATVILESSRSYERYVDYRPVLALAD